MCAKIISLASVLMSTSKAEAIITSLSVLDHHIDVITDALSSLSVCQLLIQLHLLTIYVQDNTEEWVRIVLTKGRELFPFRLDSNLIAIAYQIEQPNYILFDNTNIFYCSESLRGSRR